MTIKILKHAIIHVECFLENSIKNNVIRRGIANDAGLYN
jgi:hypothetical protein